MNSGFSLAWLLLLALTVGCGKPGVKGTVTLNDAPIAAGLITFQPADSDRPEFSATVSQGKFEVEQADLGGKYTVRINVHFANSNDAADFYEAMSREINREKIVHGEESEKVGPENDDPDAKAVKNKTTVKNPATVHQLEVTLSKGRNVMSFELNESTELPQSDSKQPTQSNQ